MNKVLFLSMMCVGFCRAGEPAQQRPQLIMQPVEIFVRARLLVVAAGHPVDDPVVVVEQKQHNQHKSRNYHTATPKHQKKHSHNQINMRITRPNGRK